MQLQDYMIFIMEGISMWKMVKDEKSEIWTSDVCVLKIIQVENKCRVFVDYKGYNILIPMGIWGFEEEIQDRNIVYEIGGEKGEFKTLFYIVKNSDLKLFCDIIYFFVSEHNLDSSLNDAFKY